jgi:hypothetical protein
MTTDKRANEEQFNELHGLVTNELIDRVKLKGECSTQDLKTAIDWLAKNNITGVAVTGSPLAGLLASLEVDEEDVQRVVR